MAKKAKQTLAQQVKQLEKDLDGTDKRVMALAGSVVEGRNSGRSRTDELGKQIKELEIHASEEIKDRKQFRKWLSSLEQDYQKLYCRAVGGFACQKEGHEWRITKTGVATRRALTLFSLKWKDVPCLRAEATCNRCGKTTERSYDLKSWRQRRAYLRFIRKAI